MRNRRRVRFVLVVTIAAIVGVVAPGGALEKKGRVTEFSAGLTQPVLPQFEDEISGYPYGLVVGPDGNLWFNDGDTERIGQITPAGVITEFSTGGASPSGIVAGPDGNLWFSTRTGIGRIETGPAAKSRPQRTSILPADCPSAGG